MILRYQYYRELIDKLTDSKNINLYGKEGIGKTYTVKECLLKDIKLQAVYLSLEYPFYLDNLFEAIAMSFGFYYSLQWSQVVNCLSQGTSRLLVLDNFDRLHETSENFAEDLSRLRMLAELENFSLLTISRLPLKYFHFASFTNCFEDFIMDGSNCWVF
ncbi:ATP-binding protein [Scytonema sp. UIC 10036]|uniref:ATP-binding protein n=1 Tax=Scytonema sp. UIC 10036 TaxID=2304196 RepID=UPI0012DAD654|nr:ATP-binding protein [Scytonema sp. UIC 10036]MUG91748.1 ATP-binding protein [Scytonema sp. UIC 10036]